MKKPILVTGGAGYIGAHVCKALASDGMTPIAYDNLVCGHLDSVKWGPFEFGDVSDRTRLIEVIKKYTPVAVLHLAAYAYVGESMRNPGKYYRNNVAGSLTLFETMRDCGVEKIIFSSSCATYGSPDSIPITEEHPQRPINPYGFSKYMTEQIIKDFSKAYGMHYVILRYFNAAGADPDGDIGELHEPETHLIPLVLRVAMGKNDKIVIYGTDYDTPDGTCIRDYIHVNDIADAHVLSLNYLNNGGNSNTFNLSNGKGFSVKEIISVAHRITGKKIKITESNRRDGDPSVLQGSSLKITTTLGWRPKYNDVNRIISTAWQWQKSRK